MNSLVIEIKDSPVRCFLQRLCWEGGEVRLKKIDTEANEAEIVKHLGSLEPKYYRMESHHIEWLKGKSQLKTFPFIALNRYTIVVE